MQPEQREQAIKHYGKLNEQQSSTEGAIYLRAK
jgi:hypothetical protein